MGKAYTIGLDIGTNSVGWAVVTENHDLIKKKMPIYGNLDLTKIKKNFWGVRLFDEGKTAAQKRLCRTTRRRYTRRRQRILYLQEIFNEEVIKTSNSFFHRLDDSFLIEEDKKHGKYPIFDSLQEEKDYHLAYPTIYHLRKKLIDSTDKMDIRLVYLACAHIIKYRGHFLIEGRLNSDNTSIKAAFSEFILSYSQFFNMYLSDETVNKLSEQIENIAKIKVSRSQKFDEMLSLFDSEKKSGTLAQFLKLIVGNLGNFKNIFKLSEDVKIQFSKEDYEEKLEELFAVVGDTSSDLFVLAKNVYDAIELSSILDSTNTVSKAKLSTSMVERYESHQADLKALKKYIKKNVPQKYGEIFKDKGKDGYAGYIDGDTTREGFYKYLKKIFNKQDDMEAKDFLNKIEQEIFLLKQRTFENGIIPHQIQLHELNLILENQSQYYPFLKENHQKITAILTFRIPYYVGPLALNDKMSSFSWVSRRSNEKITPWNFTELVDKNQSATRFIERMINHDSYLPLEKVMPKNSLVYQQYTIFNELTKVSYQNEQNIRFNLSSSEKAEIFNDLFKKTRRVTRNHLVNYFKNQYQLDDVVIEGIDTAFNATYSTYHDLLKLGVPNDFLEDDTNLEMIEDVIKILTIFEDRQMIREQLKKYNNKFSPNTLKKMERRHYNGWGRLSEKLLNGIRDKESGKTILEYLKEDDAPNWNTNRNFMQLINDSKLSFREYILKEQSQEITDDCLETVNNLTGSPAIKKGILQSLRIVDEIVEIMGYQPQNIVVEMARKNQGTKRTSTRLKFVEKCLTDFQSDILKRHPIDNRSLQSDRLYLYYLQAGKDMYTGEPLDINNLSNYDIDHIIPQSFIKDDSIDNKVLVNLSVNRGNKVDDVPSINIVKKQKYFWKKLQDAKLISSKKYASLTKAENGGLTSKDKEIFIKRQLVETRQITKHVSQILDSKFNHEKDAEGQPIRNVLIITLKSSLTSQFRQMFDLYKVREINDYHHAHDAYLNAVVGQSLIKVYPQLKAELVYGLFPKKRLIDRFKATQKVNLYTNIMKFFKADEPVCDENGEILWSEKDLIQVKKVLSYKQMNIVKKVENERGQLTKEKILPKGDSEKLIAVKKDLSPVKYGGKISPTNAYYLLITHEKGKKKMKITEIKSIPLMRQKEFEENKLKYLATCGFLNPVIRFQLPKYSLFSDEDGRKRILSGADELQKGNQMVLPGHLVALIYHSKRALDKEKESFNFIEKHKAYYEELMMYIEEFALKYTDAPANLKKIKETFQKNKDNEIIELAEAFVDLMKFNQMGAPIDFKFFDATISRRRYKGNNDFKVVTEGILINQSITGLYESRWKV
ncbi:type II CRISPR RNA-guided endonuclease Cas9 [Vagococcus vulneris]|uniref:CRISPR-associated endonuclease Cas9 n=1 Tax=Vagococcus vulneris TaxID=1977869 RepID=A0A430A0E2_9ENTE|nr:type II CRISPR RNA-guided endonuclease Cas9 [Vagococcus vulneris]RST99803.1 type II CRISPR RNA-guided endonuclease Cas9 [Vagococcus vulneris]